MHGLVQPGVVLPWVFEQAPIASGVPHQVLHTLVMVLWRVYASEPHDAGQGGAPSPRPSASATSVA